MTQISIRGNMTAPIDLRYTAGGKAVASVNVAVNRGKDDNKQTDFYRVTLWEGLAENAAQLEKGTSVIVVGRLESRQYEDREQNKRTSWEITADAFGPDLRFQTVTVSRAGDRSQDRPGSTETTSAPDEPWGVPSGSQNASWTPDSDTPF